MRKYGRAATNYEQKKNEETGREKRILFHSFGNYFTVKLKKDGDIHRASEKKNETNVLFNVVVFLWSYYFVRSNFVDGIKVNQRKWIILQFFSGRQIISVRLATFAFLT